MSRGGTTKQEFIKKKGIIVGIDFDNTIINYDTLFYEGALRRGLIPTDLPRKKKLVRDQIRKQPEGEMEWRRLQAEVYAMRLGRGTPSDGVLDFFLFCKSHRFKIYIISHKSEFSSYDIVKTNLHLPALTWLAEYNFFAHEKFGLSPNQVFFENTRKAKTNRIQRLGCTHFIDDLEETFLDPTFPKGIQKILYGSLAGPLPGVLTMAHWKQIEHYFSNDHRNR